MATMTTDRDQALAMMQNPDQWSTWPRLPLRRDREVHAKPWRGALVIDFKGDVEPKVFLNAITRDHRLGYIEYSSYDEILNDGWMIG